MAFIVLAHREPEQVARLLSALRHPRACLYLHVDKRVSLAPFSRALDDAGVDDVVPIRRYATPWGSPGLVDAALDALAAGVADRCDYFLLISGQDFPLRRVDEILAFVEEAGTRSYLQHWPVSDSIHRFHGRDRTDFYTYNVFGRRQVCIPRGEDVSFLNRKGRGLNHVLRLRSAFKPARRFPAYAHPFAGDMHWNLSRAAADHVLRFVARHPDYRGYHEHTWCPDELFFHSIVAGTDFASQYEVVNDGLRFHIWEGVHKRVLTTSDVAAALASEKLFARKFDLAMDRAALERVADRVAA